MGHPGLAVSERVVCTRSEFMKIEGIPWKEDFQGQDHQWDSPGLAVSERVVCTRSEFMEIEGIPGKEDF